MTKISRIDVHSHFIPDAYRHALEAADRGSEADHFPLGSWSVEQHLANMAAHKIDVSILSISDPGVQMFRGDAAGRELARSINEAAAAIVRSHPRSFGAFAILPLPDVAGSVAEAEYALDRLGLDGVGLSTNYDGAYLGDPRFEELLETLNERHAVVFVHPTEPPGFQQLSVGLWAPVLEFPFDTTRCVASILLAGIPARFPNLRFIFSHGGGTLPFLAARLGPFVADKLSKSGQPTDAKTIQGQLASLFYDLASVSSPAALAALRHFVPPSQLMLGFDFPFMPPAMIDPAFAALERFAGWSASELDQVYAGSALSLFPRFALKAAA